MADSGTQSKRSGTDRRDLPLEKRGYVPEQPRVPPVPPKGGTAVVSWPFAKVPAPSADETNK
jgi:hypothetical protein